MTEKMGISGRIWYLCVAAALFIMGCGSLVMFWLIITIPLGLGLWFFALIFTELAIQGRPFDDWHAEYEAKKALAKEKKNSMVKRKMAEMCDP
jgi:fatty acid desaturase